MSNRSKFLKSSLHFRIQVTGPRQQPTPWPASEVAQEYRTLNPTQTATPLQGNNATLRVAWPQQDDPPLPTKLLCSVNHTFLWKENPYLFILLKTFLIGDFITCTSSFQWTELLLWALKDFIETQAAREQNAPTLLLFQKSVTTNAIQYEKTVQQSWKTNTTRRPGADDRAGHGEIFHNFRTSKINCSYHCSNKRHFLPDDFLSEDYEK